MARTKKPTQILQLSGAIAKNPSRARTKEPQPKGKIGACPTHLSAKHKAIWNQVVKNAADGVLTNQDRLALELVVMGLHDVRFGVKTEEADSSGNKVEVVKHVGGAERDRVFKQLGKFGFTPSERSNVVGLGPEKKKTGFGAL